MFEIIQLFFLSIMVSTLLIIALSKLFYRLGILDNPKKYQKKRSPIPYSMGVVFFITFFIVSFLFVDYTYKL